jgi:hypothetical protein
MQWHCHVSRTGSELCRCLRLLFSCVPTRAHGLRFLPVAASPVLCRAPAVLHHSLTLASRPAAGVEHKRIALHIYATQHLCLLLVLIYTGI